MHLEDVNIEGFKSFSEETEMRFQPGISVIIGNNGVGKSNILDAIVWAIGEDSLDRLRCYSPEDLFFSGNQTHSPAHRVKVKLTFKDGPDKDAASLKVARKRTRDGINQFTIDDRPIEPKLFRQQLSQFNLKEALKTIIRQEQVNDLLFLNPHHRLKAVCSLMGLDSPEHFPDIFETKIFNRLARNMKFLMPEARVDMEMRLPDGSPGIDLQISMPGDRILRPHQLSGGQKTVTSLALKFALFEELQSPFFLMDEVESSLDYVHHKSMQAFLKDISSRKQLIMITHLRTTIELADTLHGVRTRPDGSSFMKFYFVINDQLLRLYKCC